MFEVAAKVHDETRQGEAFAPFPIDSNSLPHANGLSRGLDCTMFLFNEFQ